MTHMTKPKTQNDSTSWQEFLAANPAINYSVKDSISFTQLGECIEVDTTNQKIITWATSRGLHSD